MSVALELLAYKENPVMLIERPDGMSFEAWKKIRAIQQRGLKKYKKGQFIFVAKNAKLKEKGKSFVRPKE